MSRGGNRKIQERCAVIVELVQRMQPMYKASLTSDYQRHHIETIVGAGIWYIPNKSLWTGKISVEAIKSFHPDSQVTKPKLTEDHQFPRKVAARALLEFDWSKSPNPTNEMVKMYTEKYGTFNLITSRENRDLMKFQKVEVFITPQIAYANAGIILVDIQVQQLQLIKRRDYATIEAVLDGL